MLNLGGIKQGDLLGPQISLLYDKLIDTVGFNLLLVQILDLFIKLKNISEQYTIKLMCISK